MNKFQSTTSHTRGSAADRPRMSRFGIVGMAMLCALLLAVGNGLAAEAQAPKVDSVFARNMRMRNFAELITRAYGSQFRVLVSEQAGQKRASFYMSETEVEDLLRGICNAHGLWYRKSPQTGIIQIMTVEEYRQGINLYADESVEVVPILYPAPEEIGDTLARLFQDRVVWDPPPRTLGDDRDRIERALDRMDTIADRATLVEATRGGLGVIGTGRDRLSRTTGRDRLSSRTHDRFDQRSGFGMRDDRFSRTGEGRSIEDVLERQERELDFQRELAYVREQALDDTVISPGLVYISASPIANALVLRSSDATSLELVKRVIADLDRPRPQVLLEVKVLDIMLDDEEARGVDWLFQHRFDDGQRGIVSGGSARGITAEPGNIIRSSDPLSLAPQGTGIDPLATVFSYVTADLRARVQWLEDQKRIRSLATPSLLVADNEASRIFIGNEVTVLERVEPEIETFGEFGQQTRTVYNVTAPRKRIGTTLLITPKIHADRTVTIRILQEETQLGSERTVRYGQTATDQFTSQDVEERSVTTTILAADGHMVAIGGLVRERESERQTGVPVLMHTPLLGNLFRRSVTSSTKSELLVLIRPHVILAPGDKPHGNIDWDVRVQDFQGLSDFLARPESESEQDVLIEEVEHDQP